MSKGILTEKQLKFQLSIRWYLCEWFEYEGFGFQFKLPGRRNVYFMVIYDSVISVWSLKRRFLVRTFHIHPEFALYTISSTLLCLDSML